MGNVGLQGLEPLRSRNSSHASLGTISITHVSVPLLNTTPENRPSTPGLGIALMALGMFVFSAADTLAKFLTETLHPLQVVWSRQLGLVFGLLFLLSMHGFSLFRSRHKKLQITRGVMAAGSATLFIFAVAYVPLADAVAVSFVAPFIVTLFGALVLKEKVGIRRWTAVCIGFFATLIIIRPGMGAMHPAAMLVLIAATFFAIRQIISRMLSDSDKTRTTVAYTAITGIMILSIPLPFIWTWPETTIQYTLIAALAFAAALGEVLVIKALEMTQAVIVAPVHYTIIVWGTAYGYLVFNQLPDLWTWVGTAIIVASGIYTLSRERRLAN